MEYALEVQNISRSFPGVKALDEVSFKVRRGAIHALVGENGAGKSTLIKILSGVYQADGGDFLLNGQPQKFKTPYEAQQGGISVVHQELKLVDALTVKENIWLGRPPKGRFGVNFALMHRKAKELLDYIGVDIDPDALVMTLSVAQQQIVEICKALSYQSEIIIMDEPSATLTEGELEVLFRVLKELNARGITIVYISHRMEEIFSLSHEVTILRDGRHVGTYPTKEVTREKLIALMVGRTLGMEYPEKCGKPGDVILEVEQLSRKKAFRDISFTLHKGEILGFAGLVGSGRSEVARAILGADKDAEGSIKILGQKYTPTNVRRAISVGLGLVPEDRKRQGLVQGMSVAENISLANLDSISQGRLLTRKKELSLAENFKKKLRIATPDVDRAVKYLSGGNQQKVVIAKWLNANSDILIIDEPTRGIDVGAKYEIYVLIESLIEQGKSIIMISSDMSELIGMCDRIVVMHEGTKTGELSRREFSQERIMSLAIV